MEETTTKTLRTNIEELKMKQLFGHFRIILQKKSSSGFCSLIDLLFSAVFQLFEAASAHINCFLLTSAPQSILYNPLAAFPHNHCRNNGQQRERNECFRNDYRKPNVFAMTIVNQVFSQ